MWQFGDHLGSARSIGGALPDGGGGLDALRRVDGALVSCFTIEVIKVNKGLNLAVLAIGETVIKALQTRPAGTGIRWVGPG